MKFEGKWADVWEDNEDDHAAVGARFEETKAVKTEVRGGHGDGGQGYRRYEHSNHRSYEQRDAVANRSINSERDRSREMYMKEAHVTRDTQGVRNPQMMREPAQGPLDTQLARESQPANRGGAVDPRLIKDPVQRMEEERRRLWFGNGDDALLHCEWRRGPETNGDRVQLPKIQFRGFERNNNMNNNMNNTNNNNNNNNTN